MLVFCLPPHRALLPAELDGTSEPAIGRWRLGRRPDRELRIDLDDAVAGRDCALLGSLAPPAEQTLVTLLLAHTLRRAGARYVLALLPYLGYARQDRARAGRSFGARWVGALLIAMGVDEVVTVDIHSDAATRCIPLEVSSLSPAPLFAAQLPKRAAGLTFVAPDRGAHEHCEAVARAAGVATPAVVDMSKRRTAKGVAHGPLVGAVGPCAVVVDDILDTGATLLSTCEKLREAKVPKIIIVVTHAVLSGERWRDLPAAGAQRIFATDTVPGVRERGRGIIEVLPIAPLLMEALTRGAA